MTPLRLFAAAVAAACALGPGAAAAPHEAPALRLEGHGLGHGIGLSQWGAEERAVAGESYRQILGFYYPGTTIGVRPERRVRVLVRTAPRLVAGSRGSYVVRDAAGRSSTVHGLARVTAGTFDGRPAHFPLHLVAQGVPLQVGGVRYAGAIELATRGGEVLAIDDVELEEYVAAVVGAENPAYWRPAALEAQAVAARSYAIRHRRPSALFDLWPDDRSQNYVGLARAFAASRAAADRTSGEVALFHGHVADTMFSASNGGLTSAGGQRYLISRRDPFDARSPAANWGPVTVSAARVHAALPATPWPIDSVRFYYNASRRVEAVLVSGGSRSLEVSGAAFQQALGLRSTYFVEAGAAS